MHPAKRMTLLYHSEPSFQKSFRQIRKLGPREWGGSMHVLVEKETFNMWVNA
jgi:hypothetical protein